MAWGFSVSGLAGLAFQVLDALVRERFRCIVLKKNHTSIGLKAASSGKLMKAREQDQTDGIGT